MAAEVLFDVSALSFVKHANVSAFCFACVRVRSSVSSANWVDQVWVASALVSFVISQALSFVVDGDSFASGFACVLVGVSISTADWESDMSARIAGWERASSSSVAVISGADSVLIFFGASAFEVAFIVVSETVSSANWGFESFAM